MKLYFYISYFKTGGPECFHQYCDMARLLDYDAYIYYNNADSKAPCLYKDKYLHPERALIIEDCSSNILFISECINISDIRKVYTKIKIVLCWLSFDYGINLLEDHKNHIDILHVYQSQYARNKVCEKYGYEHGLDLSDYIHDDIILRGWDSKMKQNIVAYNATKDNVTPRLCTEFGIRFIGIKNMSEEEVIKTLQKCKVYMDCGTHPGKDRLPREAAVLGCVVITNRSGSAAFYEDVPIFQKCNMSDEAILYIKNTFNYYEEYLLSQENYRKIIRRDKMQMSKQFRDMMSILDCK